MSESIFSKIIRGEVPSNKIFEDDKTYALLDISPVNPGHTLVVPKHEVDHLWDLSDNEYQALMNSAKKIANHMRSKLDAKRIGVIVEGFAVPHVHIHLIPINESIEKELAKPKTDKNSPEDLQEMAELLKL